MIQQIYIQMRVSQKIRNLILYDNQFSLEIASIMGIQQLSVRLLARRNSDRLTLHELVKFYMEKGLTQDEIFEKEETHK